MKNSFALSCAILALALGSQTLAGDKLSHDDVPHHQNASVDQAALLEAREILEQINTELNRPVLEDGNEYQPVLTAHTNTEITSDDLDITSEMKKIEISSAGDLDMSCGDLSIESARMRDIIFTTHDAKERAKMQSHGVKAAGAIGSFLIGSVTGGVGLAVGGFLLDQGIKGGENEADEIHDTAAQRRTLMMGIYNAKGCNGPLEHAMQDPEERALISLNEIETASGPSLSDRYND